MNAHTALCNALRLRISELGHVSLLNVTGLFFRKVGTELIPIRVGQKGWPDIIGFTKKGRFFGVEAKTGSGKLSPEQKHFRDIAHLHNVIFIEARSIQDLEALTNE